MLLSRYVSMLSTRQGIFGALFSALLALDLFSVATAQEVKQIKLTDKYIQGFIAAQEEMTKLYEGANLDDPKVEAQAEAVAKKNGFANLAEHDDVSMNISIIMSGIDPQPRSSPSHANRSSRRSRRLRPRNPSQRRKRKRT